MPCSDCAAWIVTTKNVYEDGDEIVTNQAPDGKGNCQILNVATPSDFGCTQHRPGDSHALSVQKTGSPWHHFLMIPCVVCQGGPTCGGHCQCAGTGLVRKYDDGFVGDEKTRRHPKEP